MRQPEAPKECRALLVEISKYLDGEQPPARCRRLERHLKSCVCCATMADQVREVIAACRASKPERLPPDVQRRARDRVKALLRR